MPRRARIQLPGVPIHLIQCGNNRSACFYADEDYRFYLDHLAEQTQKHGCTLHAYCLMTNHVHLLLTPLRENSLGGLMKALGQRYVQYVNRPTSVAVRCGRGVSALACYRTRPMCWPVIDMSN